MKLSYSGGKSYIAIGTTPVNPKTKYARAYNERYDRNNIFKRHIAKYTTLSESHDHASRPV